jgi:adenosylcobinamide hydrolase
MKEIAVSPMGHIIRKNEHNYAISFSKEMLIFSTSQLNGGINTLQNCFNHKLSRWIETTSDLPNSSVSDYLKETSVELKLDPKSTTGLMTTASMKNASLEFIQDNEISIFAIITAGAGVNAVRAGDPPCYHEKYPDIYTPVGGTINILLTVEAKLPPEALARVSIIATEAKTAALQDLATPSCFSDGIATGTGTDGLIIACHKNDSLIFTDTGNHSKLGHLISTVVKRGVTKSIIKEQKDYEKRKDDKKNNE